MPAARPAPRWPQRDADRPRGHRGRGRRGTPNGPSSRPMRHVRSCRERITASKSTPRIWLWDAHIRRKFACASLQPAHCEDGRLWRQRDTPPGPPPIACASAVFDVLEHAAFAAAARRRAGGRSLRRIGRYGHSKRSPTGPPRACSWRPTQRHARQSVATSKGWAWPIAAASRASTLGAGARGRPRPRLPRSSVWNRSCRTGAGEPSDRFCPLLAASEPWRSSNDPPAMPRRSSLDLTVACGAKMGTGNG